MKNIVYLFILFYFKLYSQDTSLNDARLLYRNAANQEESCKKLLTITSKYLIDKNPIMVAYNACGKMMMANHVLNPITKLSHFNQGKLLLEKCINNNKNNIEICFLRFTIQSNAPAFLGYNNSITKDKLFLITAITKEKDLKLKQIIITYLKSSAHVTLKEKQNLNP